MNSLQEEFLKDIHAEETFQDELRALKAPINAVTELDTMIQTYNSQVLNLSTLRIDSELFAIFLVSEPNVPKWRAKKGSTDEDLRHQRATIRVIRGQILEKLRNMKKGE